MGIQNRTLTVHLPFHSHTSNLAPLGPYTYTIVPSTFYNMSPFTISVNGSIIVIAMLQLKIVGNTKRVETT